MTSTALGKVVVVLVLLAAIIGVTQLKRPPAPRPADAPAAAKALPRLLELGSTTCIPCKMMAPILDEVRRTYAGKLTVEAIDVRKEPGMAEMYGIESIPTQVILGPGGNELFRHVGFFAKEDLVAKLTELGIAP
ncbi:MAG: thioredoxin family protein [Armatimonadetes bacterium]|nr:thioredoxin family protein [Armatimonadota bacterium]